MTTSLSYQEACAYLFPRLGGAGRKWSLAPTRRLLEVIGNPQDQFAAVHVGGTNGKGSVAAMVCETLRAAGCRTALYTSPHLVDVRERMLVDGRLIGEEAFAAWTSRLRGAIEETDASFFEATTAIAFADFAARGAELAVVEVGLGGRLDSTNVLQPLVSGVTNVGLDHTEYLGDTLHEIAAEKAGIAKSGRPFVIGDPTAETVTALRRVAEQAGARVVVVPPEASYAGPLRLTGGYQRRNAAVAAAMLAALPSAYQVDTSAIETGFARAWLPGRLERRGRWLFDVAHNPAGVAALVGALRDRPPPGPVHAILGILKDKNAAAMVRRLSRVTDRLWLTSPPSAPDARRPDLASLDAARCDGVEVEWDFDRCLEIGQRGAETVLVAGSFHTVGDAMMRLPGFRPYD